MYYTVLYVLYSTLLSKFTSCQNVPTVLSKFTSFMKTIKGGHFKMPPLIVFGKTIKGGHFKMSPLIVFGKTIKRGHFKMPPLIVFAIQYCTNSCKNVPTVQYSTVLYYNVSARPRRGRRFTIELYCTVICRLSAKPRRLRRACPEGAAKPTAGSRTRAAEQPDVL